MMIGYARVSTQEQSLDLQLHALEMAGCDRIFRDSGASGAATTRAGLDKALRALRAGDILVVWRLDRLGRSLAHLIEVVTLLRKREIGFLSLQEQIDTTSAAGRFYLHMLAALAEFERELIRDRTRAGRRAEPRRGDGTAAKDECRRDRTGTRAYRQARQLSNGGRRVRRQPNDAAAVS